MSPRTLYCRRLHLVLVHVIRDLLAAPLADARELLQGRMPVPKLLQTDQGGSQVRHAILGSCLNPSCRLLSVRLCLL